MIDDALAEPGGPVRVGIVSWNTVDLLDRCLHALPAALGDVPVEVVVVDNASGDGSADAAERHRGVRVIRNADNVGYARGMNEALAGATGDVLIALNPDTEPPAGSLAALVERLRSGPDDVALVAPRLVNTDGSRQHSVYRFPSPRLAACACFLPRRLQRGRIGRRFWLEAAAPLDRPVGIDWAIGAVHVIRRSALEGRAPYDERWFMYVEDLELCWWLAGRGWRRRLEADVTVPHVGNASGAQAWGPSRTARWVDATYDWYARDRGRNAARRYAAVNTAGALWQALVLGAAAVLRRDATRRGQAEELARAVPGHARAVLAPGVKPAGGSRKPCEAHRNHSS